MSTVDIAPGADLGTSFRNAMAAVCTPVSVVTTEHAGLPYGTTVSAFASLSVAPPMVMVSLDHRSRLLAMLYQSRKFGLNVLASGHAELARNFSRKGGAEKFDGVEWRLDRGVPRLSGLSSFVACDVVQMIEGGDHVVVLGAACAADAEDQAPLTYHERAFGTHAPLDL